ncbi:MAG: hypothetical protein JW839_14320, partial [Candidatus Lokiarchaeota archaeon]|nr:hypothetical protein [Candidatus Lokiarchaeota archaeon]
MIPDVVDLKHKMVVNAVLCLYRELAAEIGRQHDFLHGNRAFRGCSAFMGTLKFVDQFHDGALYKAAHAIS